VSMPNVPPQPHTPPEQPHTPPPAQHGAVPPYAAAPYAPAPQIPPQQPYAAPPAGGVPAQHAAAPQQDAPSPVRRPVTDSPWAASRTLQVERSTSRLRKVAEGLPDWEPLPPGETFVRRPGSGL
jgi:hypothetical protein